MQLDGNTYEFTRASDLDREKLEGHSGFLDA